MLWRSATTPMNAAHDDGPPSAVRAREHANSAGAVGIQPATSLQGIEHTGALDGVRWRGMERGWKDQHWSGLPLSRDDSGTGYHERSW